MYSRLGSVSTSAFRIAVVLLSTLVVLGAHIILSNAYLEKGLEMLSAKESFENGGSDTIVNNYKSIFQ